MRIYMKQAFCVLLSVFLVFSTSAAVLATDTISIPETGIDLIDAIGTVTDESGPAINKAREAYNALSDEQKALVTNYVVLAEAEKAYEDIQAAREVEALIEKYDSDKKMELYKEAEDAYEALTEDQKMLVRNYNLLIDNFPPAPMPDYLIVIDLIDSIGTVTDESGPAINKARDAYDALSDEQKALVTNYAVLVAAEESCEDIQAARKVEALIEEFIKVKDSEDKIDSYKAAETAYDALTEEQKMLVRNYDDLILIAPEPIYDYPFAIHLINHIGTVTDESGSAIRAARNAYDILTDESKLLVSNYAVLLDAEKAYEELISRPIYGDANSDGKVTAADALLALQHAVNKIILTGNQFTAADFDGNGVITAADALSILKYSLITLSEFPIEITE